MIHMQLFVTITTTNEREQFMFIMCIYDNKVILSYNQINIIHTLFLTQKCIYNNDAATPLPHLLLCYLLASPQRVIYLFI